LPESLNAEGVHSYKVCRYDTLIDSFDPLTYGI
jgi:hypothetical protein